MGDSNIGHDDNPIATLQSCISFYQWRGKAYMRLSCRSHPLLRNIAFSLCAAVFFVTLFGNQRADLRAASDDLKKIDSATTPYVQSSTIAYQQLAPKAIKLRKSIQSYQPLNSSTKIGSVHDKRRLTESNYMPGVPSAKNDQQALLLLDRPPPSDPSKNKEI
jgi:hypothetical protein